MKKIKYLLFILIIFGGLVFLFIPEITPDNSIFFETLNKTSPNEIIVILNTGGWGYSSIEKAEDFFPIVDGIKKTINDLGYKAVLVSYFRTKENFLGKISSFKRTIFSFQKQSELLAEEVENFLKNKSNQKIIMVGLSNGAGFVEDSFKKFSENIRNNILAIEIGMPFWKKKINNSENILRITQKDPLANGEIKILLPTLFKAPFKWLASKFSNKSLSLSEALHVPGHNYSWPEVAPEIITFLKSKIE